MWVAEYVAQIVGLGDDGVRERVRTAGRKERASRRRRSPKENSEIFELELEREGGEARGGGGHMALDATPPSQPRDPGEEEPLPVDANFYFFLFVCESFAAS